mgnify:CR=1 FL=1|tara:strand:+ start:31 stop:318 length:288 start_codon:yes stop_codon:yes gene_type:complete
MEIFRSDGGGNYLSERLLDVINEVRKIDKSILANVGIVNDRKGTLNIHLYQNVDNYIDENYILSVFYIVWSRTGETSVTVHCFNGRNEPIEISLS